MNPPQCIQAITALETLQLYLYSVNDSEDAQDNLLAVEQFVGHKFRQLTQRSMRDFVAVEHIVLY
jgi:hypothetical protein